MTSSNPHRHPDWEDKSTIGELVLRVKLLFKMANRDLPTDKKTEDEIDTFLNKHFQVARINNDKSHLCHAKNICVDGNMMYIGSDNTYPSYNEEHGFWIQDKTAIDTWMKDFWTELWTRSHGQLGDRDLKTDAQLEEEAKQKPSHH